jgi:hypothetical protein
MKQSVATQSPPSAASTAETRVAAYDWASVAADLDAYGCAVLPKLLSPQESRAVAALYPEESHFRSHIHMARHGFGRGEYRYFKYPLPDLLGGLRTALYPQLADVANGWNGRMGLDERYPDDHASFLKRCHEAGQTRPTPLLLQYVAGDFNCLHRTSMANSLSQFRSQSSYPSPAAILSAANLF